MGGHGAASGVDPYVGRGGRKVSYGDEFRTLHKVGDVKFVTVRNPNESVRVPMETRTPGRIYATVTDAGDVTSISSYDKRGIKQLQIDLLHLHSGLSPHAHDGSNHGEGRTLSSEESLLVKYVMKEWRKHQESAK